ncbi:forkhead box protein P2-like [Neodiprion fabricii]|uniref:forkhead box protein P2-like n=1 Tax=Neodiprion fabricii TaxID=2872261 RepID=UPI001ED90B55|nr:forkhead box protein P2-like [Neodiprion fabricii]
MSQQQEAAERQQQQLLQLLLDQQEQRKKEQEQQLEQRKREEEQQLEQRRREREQQLEQRRLDREAQERSETSLHELFRTTVAALQAVHQVQENRLSLHEVPESLRRFSLLFLLLFPFPLFDRSDIQDESRMFKIQGLCLLLGK